MIGVVCPHAWQSWQLALLKLLTKHGDFFDYGGESEPMCGYCGGILALVASLRLAWQSHNNTRYYQTVQFVLPSVLCVEVQWRASKDLETDHACLWHVTPAVQWPGPCKDHVREFMRRSSSRHVLI
jgi:hypothetical protein